MSNSPRTAPPDQAARDAITQERSANVAVIAGAGTGKTQTIIARAVELLAPRTEGVEPLRISRMALITFTRRAAGELRFRIREQLLRELERVARRDGRRADQLREALGNLDSAFVGTIHGFADRLLRLRPVEAELSPAYVLLDDTSELVAETFWRLRRAADVGGIGAELGRFGPQLPPALIEEAGDTLRAAACAGIQLQRGDGPGGPIAALESIVARMIDTRDIDLDLPVVPDPGLDAARGAVAKLEELVQRMRGKETGHQVLRRLLRQVGRLAQVGDPAEAVRIVSEAFPRRGLLKGRDFKDDPVGWAVWKTLDPENDASAWILDKLKGPHRWLAARFVRLAPVVSALYEQIKAEHEVVDYLDLLVKLRNLLRRNLEARRFYQGLFDHIFVDEFQDTDPLQCEIVFYLCERMTDTAAEAWHKIDLAPGKLTIVGDPKQSIFRFRRADIAMYGHALERLHANHALEQRLETSFRSRPNLIDIFNQQLSRVLGKAGAKPFDPATGRANYEDLLPTPDIPKADTVVHVLPYADDANEGLLAGEGRAIEARLLARYVHWLLASGHMVRDMDSGLERAIELGDIAIIANVTTNLPLLLRELDAVGLEYTARGGALFLGHPVVRQYLLALRAIADADDGVAEAALLRPPFFALDLADHAAALSKRGKEENERTRRVSEARDIVKELRRRRHIQSPGATARDVIERTALGRAVVSDRNGKQTLAALYEVAAELDRRAGLDGLDFDAMTEIVRAWASDPVYVEAPEPTGAKALRVITIHSAKGLEFPVVILWDGFQVLTERQSAGWLVERSGRSWALALGAIGVEHPQGGNLARLEKQFGEQECRRKYYVAATRARDLLVLPLPHTKSRALQFATAALASNLTQESVKRFETYRPGSVPQWARATKERELDVVHGDVVLQEALEARTRELANGLREATRPIASPLAVTAARMVAPESGEDAAAAELERKVAGARFGRIFGTTVHRALELALGESLLEGRQIEPAVRLAVSETGLKEDLREAAADVGRALAALLEAGILDSYQGGLATEYPLVQLREDGTLLSGFVDLLAVGTEDAVILDFKTDAVRPGPLLTTYPDYANQLLLYGRMLRASGTIGSRALRLGLLFTATGEIRWLEPGSERTDTAYS